MGCCNDSNFSTAPDAELDPAQRVAYSFGMVLGVDDFKQEHAWIAGRSERGLRETIGYGVVAGLDMTLQARGGEVQIVVQPGLAIGPDGKAIAVTAPQCANLDSWLSRSGNLGEGDAEGEQVVYVLLRYAELASTPVPIPGEPCRDEASQLENSRIVDSFTLELSWQPPGTEEDDAVRQWVAWLRKIEVQDSPENGVTITEFQAAVDTLSLESAPPPELWQSKALVIPREQYTDYVSAAFEVWGRKQRLLRLAKFGPVQSKDGIGRADGAVALGRIHISLSGGALALNGELSERVRVDTLARTQVVHLRMLQEWLLSNAENDAPREAYYVLNRADERMPNVQDLFGTFFGELEGGGPAHGRIARVDSVGGRTARVVPAKLYDGPASEGSELGDYYGPNMVAPIPPSDGGTGQQTAPANGQVLVGNNDVFTLASIVAKATESDPPSLTVEHDGETHDIVLDTVQPLHQGASPTFVGATLTGITSSLLNTSTAGQIIPAKLYDGPASEGSELGDYYGPNMVAPIPPSDGGTGQQTAPANGQVLVGNNDVFTLASIVAKATEAEPASLTVEHDGETHDIVLDTVQPLHQAASPTFVGATLTGITSSVLAVNADGQVGAAVPWDGDPTHLGTTHYYAPGQLEPVRIEDGGTGQRSLPGPLQVLIGAPSDRPEFSSFVLATMTAGANVTLALVRDEEGGDPGSEGGDPLPGTEDPPAAGGRPPGGGTPVIGTPVVERPVFDPLPSPVVGRPVRGSRRTTARTPAAGPAEGEQPAAPQPRRARAVDPRPWKLVINANAAIDLPVAPNQGGTGLEVAPEPGQILLGGAEGSYVLSRLTGANEGLNIRVETFERELGVDTAQDIHKAAKPSFNGLFLTKPEQQEATHRLGWNKDTSAVVIDERPDQNSGALRYRVRVVKKKEETPINDDDQVIIVAGDAELSFTLPKPLTDEGRVLTFRSVNKELTIGIQLQNRTALSLAPNQSVTVIAVTELKQWVEIGGGNHAN